MVNTPRDALATTKSTALKLLAYCQANDWAGYDPYDALNSRIFKALPFLNFKLARLALTQGVKRCPLNLRPLLFVAKSRNPKGIALFLSSLVRLSKIGLYAEIESIGPMAEILLSQRSPNRPYSCWGYNFDWQSRSEFVPKASPNIICSTFAANALLDAYESEPRPLWLNTAVSTAEFILKDLLWREGNIKTCFSYTLVTRGEVHNANLLGSAFLCRVGRTSGEKKYIEPALDAARYSVSKQHADGAWDYSEAPTQRWIDNFHTGFNLIALRRIQDYTGTTEFDSAIRRGFDFYRTHFFREGKTPRYYHDTTYPIDIHGVAQSLITLIEFQDFGKENVELAQSILGWAIGNMWDKRGYFYYQKHPCFTIRTSFMRWSQAWMLFALTTFLAGLNSQGERLS